MENQNFLGFPLKLNVVNTVSRRVIPFFIVLDANCCKTGEAIPNQMDSRESFNSVWFSPQQPEFFPSNVFSWPTLTISSKGLDT